MATITRTTRTSRYERWHTAVTGLLDALDTLKAIQEEYISWRDSLPESLQTGSTWDLLEELCDTDLEDTASTDIMLLVPPRGGGRD